MPVGAPSTRAALGCNMTASVRSGGWLQVVDSDDRTFPVRAQPLFSTLRPICPYIANRDGLAQVSFGFGAPTINRDEFRAPLAGDADTGCGSRCGCCHALVCVQGLLHG